MNRYEMRDGVPHPIEIDHGDGTSTFYAADGTATVGPSTVDDEPTPEVPDEPTENVVATSIVDIRSAASRLSSTGPTHAALMAIADALEVLVQ